MAYDASGNWKPEDDSVDTQITGLLKPDNPFVQRAKTGALQTANQRGLGNSTLAAEAGEKAAIDSVLPVASQNASQIAQKNFSTQGFAQAGQLQTQQTQGQQQLQAQQIAGQKDLQTQQLASQKELQGTQLASQERLGFADIGATNERQSNQLASSERVAALDASTRQILGQMDAESQQRIANLNIASDQKKAAAASLLTADQTYAQEFAAIAGNASIPADVRKQYLTSIQSQREQEYRLVGGIYPVDIDWSGTTIAGALSAPLVPGTQAGPQGTLQRGGLFGTRIPTTTQGGY
jgi:hypothetical protein